MRLRIASLSVLALLIVASSFVAATASAGAPAAKSSDAADEVKDEFRTARPEIASRLRKRDPIERVAALRDLQHYPTIDAVKLLVAVGFKDDTPEVRTAAYNTLLDFKDDETIARYLLTAVHKEGRRGANSRSALPMLAVLLASDLPDIAHDVATYLDGQAATPDGLTVVTTLADQLGEHGREEDVVQLEKLTHLAAFKQEFGLRRAVVEALGKISAKESVGLLVKLLEDVKGELRADIVQYLNDVTGAQLGPGTDAWVQWWKENQETFKPVGTGRRRDAKDAPPEGVGAASSRYYGLSIYADKLLFIIDISGSMQGPRIAAAKRELMQAVDGLPTDTQFSIVAFNGDVYAWQHKLVPANAIMKRAAARWVDHLAAGSHTASYDALEAGLRFDAEAIYFLTDGEPRGGKVTVPAEIVTLITRMNYTRRMSIYTIGIGVGAPGGVFDDFLYSLARQNWGLYRRVDE